MTAPQPPTAPSHLDDIPVSNIPLETSIGDIGLSALDEHTVKVQAGGDQSETSYGPVQVNRVTIDIAARYRRDEHGTWTRLTAGYGDDAAYRAGTHTSPTRAVLRTVETALAAAITEWATANPHVLAAAQHATNARAIADARRRLDKLDEQRADAQQRVTDLERARDTYAARWARALSPNTPAPQDTTPDAPATVGSVAYCGDVAHYIVWTQDADVAWGVVDGLRLLPDVMLLDAVRAHLHERDATTLAQVQTWHTSEYADTNGTLTPPEVAHAAETVGDRLGILHRHHTFRPATVQTIAEAWTAQSQDRGTLPDDERPLREALHRLADPATVGAVGHAQLLRALVNYATTAADRLNAEMVAREVPSNPDVKETVRLIRQHLKRRSGRAWSVTHGRGTAYGWITIHVPPAQRTDRGEMSDADRDELARLLVDLPNVQKQAGVKVAASTAHRREYIARARGLTPTEYGTQYWD